MEHEIQEIQAFMNNIHIEPDHELIRSPEIEKRLGHHYLVRQIHDFVWENVEKKEEATAAMGDTFLVRKDSCEVYLPLGPKQTVRTGPRKWKINPMEEGTYETRQLMIEYGSTRIFHQSKWKRYTILYLENEPSPYPFQHDRT